MGVKGDAMWDKIASDPSFFVFNPGLTVGTDETDLAQSVIAAPLPSAWTMVLGVVVVGFLFYRLFSVSN